MRSRKKGFTLIELMVVILIVGILAAVSVPIMRGRVDAAKWAEANASAGAIRTAVRTYIAEKGPTHNYRDIIGRLSSRTIYTNLGFSSTDLNGAYFNQRDYRVTSVNRNNATCIIQVRSSQSDGPTGTGTLAADGTWSVR